MIARVPFALLAGLAMTGSAAAEPAASHLAGTWTLVAADKILANGDRVADYGRAPQGRLIVDDHGRYSLQIYKSERPKFASADKSSGSPAEFAGAVLGSSTHYGTLRVEPKLGVLTFSIDASSFANWDGTIQKRQFTLEDGVLTYRVPARPDGSIPISVWKKQD